MNDNAINDETNDICLGYSNIISFYWIIQNLITSFKKEQFSKKVEAIGWLSNLLQALPVMSHASALFIHYAARHMSLVWELDQG